MDAQNKTLFEILTSSIQYTIPKYQRAYDWKAHKEIPDFWEDLFEATSSDNDVSSSLYMGDILLKKIDSGIKGVTSYEVIDGQQRLTTIFIFLIVLRALAINIINTNTDDDAVSQDYDDDGQDLISSINGNIIIRVKKKNDDILRFNPTNKIGDLFKYMAREKWNGSFPKDKKYESQIKIVKPVYNKLYGYAENYCNNELDKLNHLHDTLCYEVKFVKIIFDNALEAYDVFERTNARGKKLTTADLIKNYLFSKSNEFQNEIKINIEDFWLSLEGKAEDKMEKMLKGYYVSRNGKVSQKNLYSKIRKEAGQTKLKQFIKNLKSYADYYEAYNKCKEESYLFKQWLKENELLPKEQYRQEEYIRLITSFNFMNIVQVQPLIYAHLFACKKLFDDKTKAAKSFIQTMRILEGYHIEGQFIKQQANVVENLYAESAHKLSNASDPQEINAIRNTIKNKFKTNKLDDKAIESAISGLQYHKNARKIKHLRDYIENAGRSLSEKRIEIFNISSSSPLYTCDHIYPQELCKQEGWMENEMNSIGNIIVIEKSLNSRMQAEAFSQKKEWLLKQKHLDDHVRRFFEGTTEWNKEQVEKRSHYWAQEYLDAKSKRLTC